jgi:hypothetical protein
VTYRQLNQLAVGRRARRHVPFVNARLEPLSRAWLDNAILFPKTAENANQ